MSQVIRSLSSPTHRNPCHARRGRRRREPGPRPRAVQRSEAASSLDAIEQALKALTKQVQELRPQPAEKSKAASPPAAKSTATSEPKATDSSLKIDPAFLKSLNWRSIGPANMGGRITALAVYEADPSTLLGRHRLRRPAQDDQQRRHLRAPVRPRGHRLDRRRRGRPVRPQHRLGRHRRGQPAQLASPTATASTSPPTAARPGRTWA